MKFTKKQDDIMDASGHLLVRGGPGSGKTTISILKAAQIVEKEIHSEQKVLFLSFARATVSRVIEAIEYEQQIPREQKKHIYVETYHSFFWRVLKSHGYLIGLPRRISILTPPGVAIALSTIRSGYESDSKLDENKRAEKNRKETVERRRLAFEEGSICFDLFASFVGDILQNSERIRKLISTKYPYIILDEFQDTNSDQWNVVKVLGYKSILLALADPEQRIYDWIGADPKRLDHFKDSFKPLEIDLAEDNHRSKDTDIVAFGNDLIKGEFQQKKYIGIQLCGYEPNDSQARTSLVTVTYAARKRLFDAGLKKWSLAILVPTKKLTRFVSDTFRTPPAGMTEISHNAVIEMEAAILGAEVIAFLMQPDIDGNHFEQFISLLRNYYHGKGGDSPTQTDLKEAESIQKAYDELLSKQAAGKSIRRNSKLVAILEVYAKVRKLILIGNPDKDWLAVRDILDGGSCKRLKGIAEEVRNIRLLERGTQLRQELSQDWRNNGAYTNALEIIKQAFLQEHFSTNTKPETGVVVMNMHKAKGKQFDEVIIFEGWPRMKKGKIVANIDRIVRANHPNQINDQSRFNFRVSVTRGRYNTTILTPKNDQCILFQSQ